jgi:hypothetical protein
MKSQLPLCFSVFITTILGVEIPQTEQTVSDKSGTSNIGFDHGPVFRGVKPTVTDQAFTLAAEYSRLGYSFGLVESLATDANSSQTELFAAYSYPLGWVEVSGGLQTFLNFDNGLRDSLELFLEARTEPIYGFNFFLGQYFEVTHGFHSYTEFKVSRRYDPTDTFALEPYALISVGNYHTETFTLNHAQFGIDSEWQINNKWSVGLNVGCVLPLDGVDRFTGSDDLEFLAGFRLSFGF